MHVLANLQQVCSQVVDKLCSHDLFEVVGTSMTCDKLDWAIRPVICMNIVKIFAIYFSSLDHNFKIKVIPAYSDPERISRNIPNEQVVGKFTLSFS